MKKVLLIALASVAVVALLLWQKPDLVVKLTFPPLPTLADTRDSLSEQDQGCATRTQRPIPRGWNG